MTRRVAAFLLSAGLCLGFAASSPAELRVSPKRIVLDRPEASQQLLVGGVPADGPLDVTRLAEYEIVDPRIIAVSNSGVVEPRGEGRTELRVHLNGRQVTVPVEVRGMIHPPPISFEHEIIPLLTRAGCNSGGCHGKAEGQAGFKLSVFGSDARADYDALTHEAGEFFRQPRNRA